MKLWDGRFTKPTEILMEEFNNSLLVDKALIEEDIAGSIAWANALQGAGILTPAEQKKISKGLLGILKAYRAGSLSFQSTDEDIHSAIERLLVEKIGRAGSKLHTGRSRNDQVATDFRLFVKKALGTIHAGVVGLQKALLARAQSEGTVIIPGYTHLQQAQPMVLAHYWLSFFYLLERDKRRCLNAIDTADIMPLGSGAIAGAGFPIDRTALGMELGFGTVSDNSIDGVAARDFALEALSVIATLSINLSRYAEDLIIWSSQEFSFIELDDAWSTGSSMMPQKKNPDSLELIRGKCGRFIGNHTRFAATLKGVGLAYYKDLQEDKEPVIDSMHQMDLVLRVFSRVIATLTVKPESIEKRMDSLLFATDVADYLVTKGMPFRQAHKVVGALVGQCVREGCDLHSLTLTTLRKFSPLFSTDVFKLFSWKSALAHRDIQGGTGPKSVAAQIKKAKKLMHYK